MSVEHHPSALRNRIHILEALKTRIPSTATNFLEASSGTGAHVSYFSATFSHITFQPSEYVVLDEPNDPATLGRIGIRDGLTVLQTLDIVNEQLSNVSKAISLDLSKEFPESVTNQTWDVVFAANVTHISPIACTHGLLEGAGRVLKLGGLCFVYGPFKKNGTFTGEGDGNAKFDASLQERNSEWGYREVEYLEKYGNGCGLELVEAVDMPANNFLLCFEKKELKDTGATTLTSSSKV